MILQYLSELHALLINIIVGVTGMEKLTVDGLAEFLQENGISKSAIDILKGK